MRASGGGRQSVARRRPRRTMGKTLLLRSAVFVGLASVVTTIIYFTPVPDIYFESCERPCHELEWPMICRIRLVIENQPSFDGQCGDCGSDCDVPCLPGVPRQVMVANRSLPGPILRVCESDILLVEVVNGARGAEASLHWRGQPLRETPVMDGVPMVTQCPVPSGAAFQYKFRASNAGTHLWHAFTGSEAAETVFGVLVVHQAGTKEPHKSLYDVDQHVIVISEWRQASLTDKPDLLLINGRHQGERLEVSAGRRYRMRLAHAGYECGVRVSVQGHELTLIALDGSPLAPVQTNHVELAPGERADVVLRADQPPSAYKIRVTTMGNCEPNAVTAMLRYNGIAADVEPDQEELNMVLSIPEEHYLHELSSLQKMPQKLSSHRLSTTLYLPYGVHEGKGHMGNVSFMLPSQPLVTQGDGVAVCRRHDLPSDCFPGHPCVCTHVIDIPLGEPVEIVLVNLEAEWSTVHLHGQPFYVAGAARLASPAPSAAALRMQDAAGRLLHRRLTAPPLKDTVAVPPHAAVALRFLADNPGYWLLHEHRTSKWTTGQAVVLHVGSSSDLPHIPEDFPRCGSWVGPQFLLI